MITIEFTMYGSRYKRGGVYSSTRPSINAQTSGNIVYENTDATKYVTFTKDGNTWQIKNSAILKTEAYESNWDYDFCIVTDNPGYYVYFENDSAYFDLDYWGWNDGHGLYLPNSSSYRKTRTLGGVTIPYMDYVGASGKSNFVTNLPVFTNVNDYLAYITSAVQPPYNWQSVSSISGKNGISQPLSSHLDINDGEPITTSDTTKYSLNSNSNINKLVQDKLNS